MTMNEGPITPAARKLGRRGFLAASAGAVALVATACTDSTKDAAAATTSTASSAATPTSPGVESSASKAFEVMNAGGTVGWEGIAVIGGGQSNKLFIMDAKSHKTVTAITHAGPYNPRTDPSKYPNLRDAHSVVFTKDFKRMFTATQFEYGAKSKVIEYNPMTLREVTRLDAGIGTHHMALSPDDKWLYAANQYDTTVTIIDTKTMKVAGALETGLNPDYISQSMYWGGKAIPSKYGFVSVSGPKVLAVFDWTTNKMVEQIPLPGIAHGVNITPDGKHVGMAGQAFEEVWVIENPSLKIVKKLPIEGSPIHISLSPENKYAYITTSDNSIFKVDTKTYQTYWASKGTVIPVHTGLSPDGKELWTLNHGMSTSRYPFLLGGQPVEGVQIWDTNTGKLINEIPMEAMPHEIQFVPYSAFGTPTPQQDIVT